MNRFNLIAITLISGLCAAGAWAQATGETDAEAATKPAPPLAGDKFPAMTLEQPPEVTGTLAIQAVQGTPGGPPIADVEITVQLVHRGMLLKTIPSRLDEHGIVMIEDLSLNPGFQPVVQIGYAGVTYQQSGAFMDAAHPQQKIEVICYEVTEDVPEWTVSNRHVMISHGPEGMNGLTVTEVMVIANPEQRTWRGVPEDPVDHTGHDHAEGEAHEGETRGRTTVFMLPAGAQDVQLRQGFHDWCCTDFTDGKLINHLPVMPGTTQMMYSYLLPAVDDEVKLDITAPAAVDEMMVVVPAHMSTATVEGLEDGGTRNMGETAVQIYTGSNIKQGQLASLTLSDVGPTVAISGTGSAGMAKTIALIGGGLLVLIAIAVVIFSRSAKPAAEN